MLAREFACVGAVRVGNDRGRWRHRVGKSKIAMNCGVAAKALQLEPVVVRGAKTTVEPQIKGIR